MIDRTLTEMILGLGYILTDINYGTDKDVSIARTPDKKKSG